MEIWDVYDENRQRTGDTMIRGEQVPEGRYHLVVNALFLNAQGETLLQRRARDKEILPDIWATIGGSALAGEDSAAACRRETEEEMGFSPDLAQGKVLLTEKKKSGSGGHFRDVWLIRQDVPLAQMRYQPEEVQDARWILPEKIAEDPGLWAQLTRVSFWEKVYPYLCLESMRIRIPLGTYRHYKGNRYQVTGLSLHSETLEPMVIYRALYGPGETWVRPARMWNEWVTAAGKTVRRFALE